MSSLGHRPPTPTSPAVRTHSAFAAGPSGGGTPASRARRVGGASRWPLRAGQRRRTEEPGRDGRSPARCTRTLLDLVPLGTPASAPSGHAADARTILPATVRGSCSSLRSSSYPTHCRTSLPASFFQERGKPMTRKYTRTRSTDSRIFPLWKSIARSSATRRSHAESSCPWT